MAFIIFKNPTIALREEEFGGLVKIGSEIFILNRKRYLFLKNFNKPIKEKKLNNKDRKLTDILIKKGILLKIDKEKAYKIMKKYNI